MEDQHINYQFKHTPIIVYGFIKRNRLQFTKIKVGCNSKFK